MAYLPGPLSLLREARATKFIFGRPLQPSRETRRDIVPAPRAGLGVYRKTVVACRLAPDAQGKKVQETKTFATTTANLFELSDWRQEGGVTPFARESTGERRKPVHKILEAHFTLLLVNARHIKNVPGRKTDVKDAQWIVGLLQRGLLRARGVPQPARRELRVRRRHRSNFIRKRATRVNCVQKALEGGNSKRASVATDVMGVSVRALLTALVAEGTDRAVMAEQAKGRLREKRDALEQAPLRERPQQRARLPADGRLAAEKKTPRSKPTCP